MKSKKHQILSSVFRSKQKIKLLMLIFLILIALRSNVPFSIAVESSKPQSNSVSQKTISESVTFEATQNVTINFTYEDPYKMNTYANFELNVSIDSGALVVNYFQIIYQVSGKDPYQFLSIIGDVAIPGNTLNVTFEEMMTSAPESTDSAQVSFKFGYYLDGVDFGQYESTTTGKTVSIEGLDPDDGGSTNGTDIWFLWWEFPTMFSAIAVNAVLIIGIFVLISVTLNKRQKKKRLKMENSVKKEEAI